MLPKTIPKPSAHLNMLSRVYGGLVALIWPTFRLTASKIAIMFAILNWNRLVIGTPPKQQNIFYRPNGPKSNLITRNSHKTLFAEIFTTKTRIYHRYNTDDTNGFDILFINLSVERGICFSRAVCIGKYFGKSTTTRFAWDFQWWKHLISLSDLRIHIPVNRMQRFHQPDGILDIFITCCYLITRYRQKASPHFLH